ncbi:hypothetical protein RBG61_01465 [Paludicola sp. MB14-C6]|uniref:hypothetical protein n=1 Tax=Paludihabitans sp. MB14-C6 TaxID=3070656 RepID=UPI0027DAF611|nr:hypothetical protein [Paludicola sp. MB14-C6]WMJ23358.1 hypothetical protein RBG61_01465 [Paludicola sp. MB14-C6]
MTSLSTFKLVSERGVLKLKRNGVVVASFNSLHNAVLVKQILEKDEEQTAYQVPKVLEKVMGI